MSIKVINRNHLFCSLFLRLSDVLRKTMARRRPSFISPSGRFIPILYRQYKRSRQYYSIIKNLPYLLNTSLAKKVPEIEPGCDLNVDYFRSKCDLQNPRCVKHIRVVEAGIRNVVASINLSAGEAEAIADDLSDDLKKVFKSRGYRSNLHIYGSYVTGLCCVDSDVDVIFEFRGHNSRTTPQNIPASLEKILNQFPNRFAKVKLITNTRVPFIKFFHRGTGKECNLTFENKMGIQNCKLIKLYLTMNRHLKTLTLYLKHLLNKYKIRGIGRITTHILFWLVVFFMQQKGLLPAVSTVRKACTEPNIVSYTNCAVPDSYRYSSSSPNVGLYSLLVDFLAFYRDFKLLKFVMSPNLGKAFPIEDVESLKSRGSRSFAASFINLQHPSDLELNLTKQTSMKTVNRFRVMCCHISKLLPHCIKFSRDYARPLDVILREDLPYHINQPDELIQCAKAHLKNLNTSKGLTGRVIRTVRHLMETVFQFKAMKIVKVEVPRKMASVDEEVRVPTVYFSYSSTAKTWGNGWFNPIVPSPRYDKLGQPMRKISVSISCEIFTMFKEVKVMIESEAHFTTFLKEYAESLLLNVFDMNV